jgi:rubredoxin
MKKYVCSVCGFVYDEAAGIPEAGIAPGTRWEDLPENWACPLCGASKSEFRAQEEAAPKAAVRAAAPYSEEHEGDLMALNALEKSALCSNLARGCEKQYKTEEAGLFRKLSDYFKAAAAPAGRQGFESLATLIERDLEDAIPSANAAAAAEADRGALRALVWNEKVTRILKSLLARYGENGAAPDDAGVYVCTICGFVYVGDRPPEVCPVCKVPNWKFEKVEGR